MYLIKTQMSVVPCAIYIKRGCVYSMIIKTNPYMAGCYCLLAQGWCVIENYNNYGCWEVVCKRN